MLKKMALSIMCILILSSSVYVVSSEEATSDTYVYYPTGDIIIGWGPGTGSGYTEVDDEIPDGTGTYVGTSFEGNVDIYSFTPDELNEIFYVTVYARFITDFIGSRFCIVLYDKSTETYVYSPPTQLSASGEWVTISYTWETNPFTGLQWTYEDIVDLGVGICAEYCDRGAAVFCTQIYLEIIGGKPSTPDEGSNDNQETNHTDETTEEISIEDLIDKVRSIDMKKRFERRLIRRLKCANRFLERDKTYKAEKILNSFIRLVNRNSGRKIPHEQANELIGLTNNFLALIQ